MTTTTQIDTSTLSNQSLATALLVHTFTNTTRVRKVFVQVDLDQIAGNGNYTVYATIQRSGAGSAFRVIPITTAAVASGITAAAFQTAGFPLNATDVVKVYVLGLAGDTTTPDIVTRVWEELPFSAAEYTAPPTAAQNADAVWDELRADHVDAGTFGENVIAELDSATQTLINDIPTNAELAAALATLNDLSAAEVNAELLDVLNTDTFGELSSPPAATSSLRDKLTWLFMWSRNKATETYTQRKLFADDGTTVVSTEAVEDDGTTFTKGEAS